MADLTEDGFEGSYASACTFRNAHAGSLPERRVIPGTMRLVVSSREAPDIEALAMHPGRLIDSDSDSLVPDASCPGGLTVDDDVGRTRATPEQLSTWVKAVEACDALR